MMENEVVKTTLSADQNPAAQYNVRPCSFDPSTHLINLEVDPNKPQRPYLTVDMRVHWFQTWCQENGKKYFIEENFVEAIPSTSFIQSKCLVYVDGEVVGVGVGGFNLNGHKDPDYCIQTCQTIAKGRALANAGFGSVFSSTQESENGSDIPCDSGVTTNFMVFKPQFLGPDAGNPMVTQAPAPAATPVAPNFQPTNGFNAPTFTEQPVHKVTEIPETDNAPKTRDEALRFIVPIKSEWQGHMLSEVMAKDPKVIRYYATRSRHADLKKACQLILEKD